ncbi:hypothetical protein AB833_17320 [Chromatiales bacterium (ex Bugula neritina AB1)]|nr:hypothetical protein AB833_17320 [Chromatiales bacterium (ex Bugula neritina AB1)]
MPIENFYTAAQAASLLTLVQTSNGPVHCAFRAPDESVLDGLGLSRDYQIDYPASWLTLVVGDRICIHDIAYHVKAIRAIGDGAERRAHLARLSELPQG